ncbi:MAG: DUF1887 family protein [Lachnospiraceae bacterium]|nr:DUF1887 family protein [Lachnospiraceae bacterium]
MKTLVEFWDENPMNNVYGALACSPDRVLYLSSSGRIRNRHKRSLPRFFSGMGRHPELIFREVAGTNLDRVSLVLEEILDKEENICFDLTGGSEVAMAALGQLSIRREISMIRFNPETGKIELFQNCSGFWRPKQDLQFCCRDIVNLMGGILLDGHGHFDGRDMDEELKADSLKVWSVYRNYYRQWSTQVFYLQKMSAAGQDPLLVRAPGIVHRDAYNMVACNENILKDLERAGVLSQLDVRDKQVCFRYKNRKLKEMLAIAGIWLEIYCFLAAKESGVFQDAQISALINWDGKIHVKESEEVHNEIDVLLVRGLTPVFISCKSGAVNASSLYEISVLARELGGVNARKVLATTMPLHSNAPNVVSRARQMGVELVEVQAMSLAELGKRLAEISESRPAD